jgi:hypothetical protein
MVPAARDPWSLHGQLGSLFFGLVERKQARSI